MTGEKFDEQGMTSFEAADVGALAAAESDRRTVNSDENVMRHAYRVLSDTEKAAMVAIKDHGLALHNLIRSLGSSRELSLAITKAEEAVMWAVKHITR